MHYNIKPERCARVLDRCCTMLYDKDAKEKAEQKMIEKQEGDVRNIERQRCRKTVQSGVIEKYLMEKGCRLIEIKIGFLCLHARDAYPLFFIQM